MANKVVKVAFSPSPLSWTFTPPRLDIDPGATDTIRWEVDTGSTFAFAALVFHKENPFSDVVVTDKQITVLDDNGRPEEHQYVVLVKANGTYYSSKGLIVADGPTIRNR